MSKVWGERFAVVPDAVLTANVSNNAKVLWAVLARYADPDGHCYPSVKTLGEILGCSHDTISRAKKELVAADLLECTVKYDESGRRTADDLLLLGARRKIASGDTRSAASSYKARGSKEVETTSREKRKDENYHGPAFECPVCPKGLADPSCGVCAGTGTFTLEAAQ